MKTRRARALVNRSKDAVASRMAPPGELLWRRAFRLRATSRAA
jgi:hypothetical protein